MAATEIGTTATTCSQLLVVVVVWMELVASMWLADADSATVDRLNASDVPFPIGAR